jgi:hypothetical protein
MFRVLKYKLSTSPVLKFPDFTKPFEVHTNASEFAIGCVLMQEEHPIAFENTKLVRAWLRWPTHEKELFAMVSCLKC